jgi:hypothetical protein
MTGTLLMTKAWAFSEPPVGIELACAGPDRTRLTALPACGLACQVPLSREQSAFGGSAVRLDPLRHRVQDPRHAPAGMRHRRTAPSPSPPTGVPPTEAVVSGAVVSGGGEQVVLADLGEFVHGKFVHHRESPRNLDV